jgi:hypothetical protein
MRRMYIMKGTHPSQIPLTRNMAGAALGLDGQKRGMPTPSKEVSRVGGGKGWRPCRKVIRASSVFSLPKAGKASVQSNFPPCPERSLCSKYQPSNITSVFQCDRIFRIVLHSIHERRQLPCESITRTINRDGFVFFTFGKS